MKMAMTEYKQFLIAHYASADMQWLSESTGRAKSTIRSMASSLGLYRNHSYVYGGYRYIVTNPGRRGRARYSQEHRVVLEEVLGRLLLPQERVHHIDGDPLNNDPSNLELYATAGLHYAAMHRQGHKHTEAAKTKIRAARAKQVICHSEETKRRISEALKAHHAQKRAVDV